MGEDIQSGWGVSTHKDNQVLKILCPHCEELVKVTYSVDSKGEVKMSFTQFEK